MISSVFPQVFARGRNYGAKRLYARLCHAFRIIYFIRLEYSVISYNVVTVISCISLSLDRKSAENACNVRLWVVTAVICNVLVTREK